MTATMTILRYGPERNEKLAYPEGHDACFNLRNLYAKQRKERPLFHFVAATSEDVSQETAQMISNAYSIEGVDCVKSYGLDAFVRENYKEGGIAEAIAQDNKLRMHGGVAGVRLRQYIDAAFNNLEDSQHGLVIVDGFDLTFWAQETVTLHALKVYEALTGYKGTRAKPGAKVFYQGVSPLEAVTLAEDPLYHLQLPKQGGEWTQVGTREPVSVDDDEVIVLNTSSVRAKKE